MKLKLTIGLLIAAASLVATCAAQSSCIAPSCSLCPSIELNDRNTTQKQTYYNVRDYEYGEFPITCPGAPTGIWNTIGMNNLPGYPNNSIPAPIWRNWSDDAVKKEYGASVVYANAPRRWTMDTQILAWSTNVRNLDGLFTRWGADIGAEQGNLNYVPTNVTCNRTWIFAAEKPAFLLDDPDGTTFVMQSYSLINTPNMTLKDLPTLGKQLKLPAGWKYRTKVLNKELTINGIGTYGDQWQITQDDLLNTYSACLVRGDQTSCNYQP